MLPAVNRVTDPSAFREVTRGGRRSLSRTLVTHLVRGDGASGPSRAGFVVGKAVGNSVVRHRVQRRLRHLVRPFLDELPAGSRLVVRALPPAALAGSSELGADLASCLARGGRP